MRKGKGTDTSFFARDISIREKFAKIMSVKLTEIGRLFNL